MKISRMSKGEWNKVRAFFDLETEEGFTIKGFKVVQGNDGMFVGFPSQKNKDDEYQDTIFADKTLRQKVNQVALEYYNNGGSNEIISDGDVPF
jgi:stage V sporulation protein G|tara:strand:- start:623 stop:901 length:279 start_codon:yes stop_codon:yes gene_type:complete